MDCSITIEGIISYQAGNSSNVGLINMYGVAIECTNIAISVQNGNDTFSGNASVDSNGGWSAEIDITAADLPCDAGVVDIDITARCETDDGCFATTKLTTFVCQTEGACPHFIKFGATAVDDADGGCFEGKRQVVFSAELTAPPPDGASVVVEFWARQVGSSEELLLGAIVAEPGVLLSVVSALSGGSYSYGLRIVLPAFCPGPVGVLDVPDCPSTAEPVCPAISFDDVQISEKCTPQGRRIVTASVTVTPEPGSPVDATLQIRQGDTIVATMESRSGATSQFALIGEVNLLPGDYSIAVDVTGPNTCNVSQQEINVPPCLAVPPPITGGDPEPDLPDDEEVEGFAIPWCLIVMIAGFVMAVFGGILLGIGFCLMGFFVNPIVVGVFAVMINVGLVLLLLGILILLLWLILCGSCLNNCHLLAYLKLALAVADVIWAGFLFVGSALTFLSPFCFVGWAIDFVSFSVLLTLVIYWEYVAGCIPWPRGWPNWARVTLPDWLRSLCRQDN